jgi:peptide/nickel transport system substrate-binding protein
VVDDATIEFTLERPGASFLTILSLPVAFPAPAHLVPEPDTPWPDAADAPEELAFNGPYTLASYKAGVNAVLTPNPHWRADYSPVLAVPRLDTLDLRFMSDADAIAGYIAGDLGFARAEATQVQTLAARYGPTGEYTKVVQPSTRALQMNLAHPPLDNLNVRLALGRAINWQRMIDECSGSRHQYTTTWIPAGIPAGQPPDYQAQLYVPSSDEARRLLAEAGGINRELSLIVLNGTESECQGKFIQQELGANLGVTTFLEILDAPTRSARFRTGAFDLLPGGWIHAYPDPEDWVLGKFEQPGVGLNHYNCNNAEIQRLLQENAFNLDQSERIAAYERINEIIVTDVCGVFPYSHEMAHYLKKAEVAGMYENADSQDAFIAGDWAVEAWGFYTEQPTESAPSTTTTPTPAPANGP